MITDEDLRKLAQILEETAEVSRKEVFDAKEEVGRLARMLENAVIVASKNILSAAQAAAYLGVSTSYLAQMRHRKEIPYTQPNGKMTYFIKSDLDEWMLKKPSTSDADRAILLEKYRKVHQVPWPKGKNPKWNEKD